MKRIRNGNRYLKLDGKEKVLILIKGILVTVLLDYFFYRSIAALMRYMPRILT